MTLGYGATIAKRRLSRRLQELRGHTRLTADLVGDQLSWGRGKIGRIEANVWRRPELSDVRDLLCLYGVGPDQQHELEDLARRARARAWWREFDDVFSETEFAGFEQEATRISCFLPLTLPGLLQTPAYARAHLAVGTYSPSLQDRARLARQRRQEILHRPTGSAPELVAVLTEAPLRYRWGTDAQQRAQLHHLLEVGSRPGVELRLLRFDDGLPPGLGGPINIFEFPHDEPPAVFLETDFAIREVTTPTMIDQYVHRFDEIRKAALDPAATAAHLSTLIEAAPA